MLEEPSWQAVVISLKLIDKLLIAGADGRSLRMVRALQENNEMKPRFIGAKPRKKEKMAIRFLPLCGCILFALIISAAFGEDAFEPVKVVYMTNGETIYCQMGSIEGTKMVLRKANGSVSVPLQNVNFEKTFPKYQKQEGETVLLVHAGQLYRDEFIIVSNLRMIHEEENTASRTAQVTILCDVINRSDPCQVRVSVLAKDFQGNSRFAIDLDSDSRVGRDEKAVLKRRLGASEAKLENLITNLKIGDVERRNVQPKGEYEDSLKAKLSPERVREQKIKSLKEAFLK